VDAKSFYGDSYNKAKDPAKLDKAFDYLNKAIANETANGGAKTKINEGMLTLACKAENEAFA
jgi:ABC-type uncharacterized transport system YnjBCD substrate-binding protein